MESKIKLIVDSFGKERFKFNEPLKIHTTLKAGGPATLFFIAFTIPELVKIITMSRELKIPFFLFGTGSKMMISDSGFDGLVIQNRTRNIQTISVKGKVSKNGIGVEEALIEVESGVSILKFQETLKTQGFESEGFADLAGSLGGNLVHKSLQSYPLLQSRVKSIKVLDQSCEIDEIESSQLRTRLHIILSAVFLVRTRQED